MHRIVIFVVLTALVVGIAFFLRRRGTEAPSQRRWAVPDQLDRADFERPGAPWLVAVFSSATCDSCADAVETARLLASADVVVQEVEVAERADLHHRYNVEAVPTLILADRDGVVRA